MSSKKTLNAKNLEALGAEQLAGLLMEISTGSAAAKRRLRLALAGAQSPKEAAQEVQKRLLSLARSRAKITWRKRRAFAEDLESQRRAAAGEIAAADPREGLDLLWRILEMANGIHARCEDPNGVVTAIFSQTLADLAEVAQRGAADPVSLAERCFTALQENHYGQFDQLIPALTPALGDRGLAHLKSLLVQLADLPVPEPEGFTARGRGSHSPAQARALAARHRTSLTDAALMQIAEAAGDVDAVIARYSPAARALPEVAADIARRLLDAGRVEEAWAAIEAADPSDLHLLADWHEMRLAVLDALGRKDDAQAMRWQLFTRFLSVPHLRAHLKALPDFDSFEAEERAMVWAEVFPSAVWGLRFFVEWGDLYRAAALAEKRAGDLDGDLDEYLVPLAEALAPRHPRAALIIYRGMIDFVLRRGRVTRYRQAGAQLARCGALAEEIGDWGELEPQEAYLARLRQDHARKTAFWKGLASAP